MASLAPQTRVRIEGGPEGLEIVIPAGRNVFVVVFLGVWLAGWFMGEMNVLDQIRSGRMGPPGAFVVFWLLFWTAGGLVALYVWPWRLVGKERILMGTSTLRMMRDILGFGRTRVYELRKIARLQVVPPSVGSGNRDVAARLSGLAGGAIEFEYERRAVRFGFSLDEAEARAIVDRMRQRYAFRDSPPAV